MHSLLALELGSLFAVGFLLISFIGWIMNLINSQNPPAKPNRPAQRPQPRDRKVQTEIEDFLQQAMGRRGPQQPDGELDGIEIVEPRPARRGAKSRRLPQSKRTGSVSTSSSPASASPTTASVRPGEGVASRQSVASQNLGSGVRSHIKQHMSPRMGQQVDQHLPHLVEESVSDHLGDFRADDRDTRRGVMPTVRSRAAIGDPTAFMAELRKPSEMRKAVILQEILSKPRALRKG